MLLKLEWSGLFACGLILTLSWSLPADQECPIHTTLELADGSSQPVYLLTPGQMTIVDPNAPDSIVAPGKQYPYYNWLCAWFALPIRTGGHYAVYAAPRDIEYGQPVREWRAVMGVHAGLEDLTEPGIHGSAVTQLARKRGEPDVFVFRGESNQVWAAELILSSSQVDKALTVGAMRAELLAPGQSRSGHLAQPGKGQRDLPLALYQLVTTPGEDYELTLDADEACRLLRLTEVSPTAWRLSSSMDWVVGEYQVPIANLFTAEPDTTYLAMVMLTAERSDYKLDFEQIVAGEPAVAWKTIQDDDGEQDSQWGQVSTRQEVLYKQLVLPDDPTTIKHATIQYRMGSQPWDWDSNKSLGQGAPADKQWSDLLIHLNDHLILKRPLDEVGSMGWYEFAVDPSLLRPDVNLVTFTKEGSQECFYLAIDLDSDHDRSYCTLGGEVLEDELRPCVECNYHVGGHGEYMVRLKYLSK